MKKIIFISACITLFAFCGTSLSASFPFQESKTPTPIEHPELLAEMKKMEGKGYQFLSDYHYYKNLLYLAIYQSPKNSEPLISNPINRSYLHKADLTFISFAESLYGEVSIFPAEKIITTGSHGRVSESQITVFPLFPSALGFLLTSYTGSEDFLIQVTDIYKYTMIPDLVCSFPSKYPVVETDFEKAPYRFEVISEVIYNAQKEFSEIKLTKKVTGQPVTDTEKKIAQDLHDFFQGKDDFIITLNMFLNWDSPEEAEKYIQIIYELSEFIDKLR